MSILITSNCSASNLSPELERAARIEAYKIAESVIGIFNSAFPDISVIKMALPIALDVAEGRSDHEVMAATQEWAHGALQGAMDTTCRVGPNQIWKYHAACMAAQTVVMALDPVIDLDRMKKAAAEAMKYSESPSQNKH